MRVAWERESIIAMSTQIMARLAPALRLGGGSTLLPSAVKGALSAGLGASGECPLASDRRRWLSAGALLSAEPPRSPSRLRKAQASLHAHQGPPLAKKVADE